MGNVSGNAAPYGGNTQPFLTQFPFLAAPNPLPGETGTVGFPAHSSRSSKASRLPQAYDLSRVPSRAGRRRMAKQTIQRIVACRIRRFSSCLAARAQSGQHETDNTIRFFQWKVSQDPDDFFNYDRLGTAYIQKARETGDVTYYNLAAARHWKSRSIWSPPTPKPHLRRSILRPSIMPTIALAKRWHWRSKRLTLNPPDITPYALIGDARSEMGEYSEAWAAYRHLQNPKGPQSAASGVQYLEQSRESAKSLLTGDTKAAIDHMRRAVDIAVESRMARETIAWSNFTLGEELLPGWRSGERARLAYNDALKTYPDYHRALAGSAKVSSAEGRLDEAIGLYRESHRRNSLARLCRCAWRTIHEGRKHGRSQEAVRPGRVHRPAQQFQSDCIQPRVVRILCGP